MPDYEFGFTPPNIYRPRPNWLDRLRNYQPSPPPAASWQSDMIIYADWVHGAAERKTPQEAWEDLEMEIANAKTAVDPASGGERGIIPPEIFSHVLARSRATTKNPDDDVPGIVIVD